MNENEKKYDPGLGYLRKALRTLITKTGATEIRLDDGSEVTTHPASEDGVMAAASWAPEIDGILQYYVGEAVLRVIFDGPYSEANAAEIINDMNQLGWDLTRGLPL